MLRRAFISAVIASFSPLAIPVATSVAAATDFRGGIFDPPRAAPEFSLTGSDGNMLKLGRFRGKVVALGFGYTFCPDVCPTTLLYLAQAREKLGAAGKDFQVIYVTVDPERDSPELLRQYLGAFDSTFVGGTGTPTQLDEVRKTYGVVATRQPAKGNSKTYFVHHSASVYLIDRSGKLRAMMPYGVSVDDIVHDVKALLAP
jgi:protein SCO1/2